MDAFILLDRSGSMATKWSETLAAINGYVRELAHAAPETRVTLALFDDPSAGALTSPEGLRDPSWFHLARTGLRADGWKPLSETEASPRGGTPLFDAVERIVECAEGAGATRSVIVIMTDGQENASRAVSGAAAKGHLDRCRDRGWQVVFLGADFDTLDQANDLGASLGQSLNLVAGSYSSSMDALAHASVSYIERGDEISL